MKVKNCLNCKFCKRYVWSQKHKTNNYHAIGITHAYHYCEKYNKKILEIKECKI